MFKIQNAGAALNLDCTGVESTINATSAALLDTWTHVHYRIASPSSLHY